MAAFGFVPLLSGDRSGHPDLLHWGAFALVDAEGHLKASAGDPQRRAFLRSSAKPFQALAFVRRGLAEELDLTRADLACVCASHSGEERHVESSRRILAAAGLEEAMLRCGRHAAINDALKAAVARGELETGAIHNNCSGKHSAMLATCRHEGWPLETYDELLHPLQQENLQTLASLADLAPAAIDVGLDNCTVPTFSIPLHAAAFAAARLRDPRGISATLADAAGLVAEAMTSEPGMVGGLDRLDTALMEVTCGRLLTKTGANGYHLVSVAGVGTQPGLGFAMKMAGGEVEAHKAPALLGALRQLNLLDDGEHARLTELHDKPFLGCRGAEVGRLRFHEDAIDWAGQG